MENQDKIVQSDPLKQNLGDNPSPMGGPQFGLDNKPKGFRKWIDKYGSSVILPIITLLILAGGIYLYASQKGNEPILSLKEGAADIRQEASNLTEEIFGEPTEETTIESDTETAIKKIIPASISQGGMVIETAVKGDGVTHLARRALKSYLNDHPEELTNEHKIYIEDYLKDKTGSRPLEIGEEVTFSEDLIKQAIDASLELTEAQLKNLEQYSALVAW
ncbi:MAG: hypothetical protein CMI55_01905 [Parcubacteria group bacterium]|nr:hypothetical protein [Parcubacteria group bacterium]